MRRKLGVDVILLLFIQLQSEPLTNKFLPISHGPPW